MERGGGRLCRGRLTLDHLATIGDAVLSCTAGRGVVAEASDVFAGAGIALLTFAAIRFAAALLAQLIDAELTLLAIGVCFAGWVLGAAGGRKQTRDKRERSGE